MAELTRTLKDPALVAAANAITGALIDGFNVALKAAASAIKFVRAELVRLGMVTAKDQRDTLILLEERLADAKRSRGMVGVAMRGAGGAQALELQKQAAEEIRELERMVGIARGLAEAEARAEEARIDAQVAGDSKPAKPGRTSRATKPEQTFSQYIAELRRLQNAERAKALADWQEDLVRETDAILKDSADKAADGVVESITKSYEERFGERVTAMTVFAQEAARSMQSAFADFLFDPFENGLKGMLAGFINVIRRMLAELAAQQLLSAFFGAFAGTGGIVGDFASAALAAIKPRAKGGPVTGSSPYLVGERGPELFVPSTAGSIIPNGAGMGGGVAVSYNIDARGATMELTQALPTILADNNRRIFDELDRRYGIR